MKLTALLLAAVSYVASGERLTLEQVYRDGYKHENIVTHGSSQDNWVNKLTPRSQHHLQAVKTYVAAPYMTANVYLGTNREKATLDVDTGYDWFVVKGLRCVQFGFCNA